MASYDTGYEDELFLHPVGPSFHCGICYNVVKNPVMCRHNEHLFCRACITRHLMNSQTCPSCLEALTVDTLSQPSRTVMNLLSELKIHCHFFNRGCEKFIELGNLERHVVDCGFAPAVCSNEGCRLEVNKQDLLHHETSMCVQGRVHCHSCSNIRQEINAMKVHLAAVNKKLNEVSEKFDRNERRVEENIKLVKDVLEEDVVAKVELVQEQLKKQEESNRQLKADNAKMKKSLNEIVKQLERMTQQTSHEVQDERNEEKKGIGEADGANRNPKGRMGSIWFNLPGAGPRNQKYQRPGMNQQYAAQQPPANAANSSAGYSAIPNQDFLNPSVLAQASPSDQKQMLGERLYSLIQQTHPDIAGEITGMLLEIDNAELLHMLEFREALAAKVEQAVSVLQAYQARDQKSKQKPRSNWSRKNLKK